MIHKKRLNVSIFLISVLIGILPFTSQAKNNNKPALMLANVYHKGVNLDNYWVSEKYDGVRAVWDGKQLISRGGNVYKAPLWFTRYFPDTRLDGELWIARQQFEQTVSIVRDDVPNDKGWGKIKFMVFDLPDSTATFDQRIHQINTLLSKLDINWLQAVKQWKVKSHTELMSQLTTITQHGAEGLMLHRGASYYKGKRSGDLLKVKPYQDAEAVVIKHIPGKGKFNNMLGAILVEMPDKKRFSIGTGFSNRERMNPPALGTTITYQFRGKTKNGIPRFASFLRIRSNN